MKATQLQAALDIARSDAALNIEDIGIFDGYGLRGFEPITCTVEALAMLIRWECVQLNGEINAEALAELARVGRHKFTVIDRMERGAPKTIEGPPQLAHAFVVLSGARTARADFVRTYGRERGLIEWASAREFNPRWSEEAVKNARGVIAYCLHFARNNGYDWRYTCRQTLARVKGGAA